MLKPGDMLRVRKQICIYTKRFVDDVERSWGTDEMAIAAIVDHCNLVLLIAIDKEELLVMTHDGKYGWTWPEFFEAAP